MKYKFNIGDSVIVATEFFNPRQFCIPKWFDEYKGNMYRIADRENIMAHNWYRIQDGRGAVLPGYLHEDWLSLWTDKPITDDDFEQLFGE